jgi:hypothetical protein
MIAGDLKGIVATPASSNGSSVCWRKATMMASSSSDKLVDFGSFGPVGRSATESRCFHFERSSD